MLHCLFKTDCYFLLFYIPWSKNSRGKIVMICSATLWLPCTIIQVADKKHGNLSPPRWKYQRQLVHPFLKERKREVTPYRDEPGPASMVPLRPTTPGPNRPSSPVDPNVYYSDRPVTPAPPEWTSYDAPMNFTWVIPDELCGMGWPKSRDQVITIMVRNEDILYI